MGPDFHRDLIIELIDFIKATSPLVLVIEKEMPKLEEKRAEILEQLNNESDYEKILKLSSELELLSGKLEEHELRWLELQEKLN